MSRGWCGAQDLFAFLCVFGRRLRHPPQEDMSNESSSCGLLAASRHVPSTRCRIVDRLSSHTHTHVAAFCVVDAPPRRSGNEAPFFRAQSGNLFLFDVERHKGLNTTRVFKAWRYLDPVVSCTHVRSSIATSPEREVSTGQRHAMMFRALSLSLCPIRALRLSVALLSLSPLLLPWMHLRKFALAISAPPPGAAIGYGQALLQFAGRDATEAPPH